MISEHDRLWMIDQAERDKSFTGFFMKPTFELIIKSLNWSIGKTYEEIQERIAICEERVNALGLLKHNWQLIIETLRWVLGEVETDPLQSRRELIPGA